MAKKSRTARVKAYMDAAAGLGCLACLLDGIPGTPASLHHPRARMGLSERGRDMDVIPLCPAHHKGDGVPMDFVSLHMRPKQFFAKYGDEDFLSELTKRAVIRSSYGSDKEVLLAIEESRQ